MQYLRLYHGALPTSEIYAEWEAFAKERNCGALCVFTGIVRQEESKEIESTEFIVSALSFDVYEPLLRKWFESWQAKVTQMGALLLMAHSVGDVARTQSSYMCAVISRQRRSALALYEDFIEDFKANAPIWKYDVIEGKRVFAMSRSTPIEGSGVLG